MAGKKPPVPSSGSVQPSTGAPSQVDGKASSCKFNRAWIGPCDCPTTGGTDYCANHHDIKCDCGNQATKECAETDGLVCGHLLCPQCEPTHMKGHYERAGMLDLWEEIYGQAATVADVPGLSIADQTDEAVTSHQTEVE